MQAPVSPAERVYIRDGVEADMRTDGRGRLDYRAFEIQTGVQPYANGSARIKLETTEVLVCVNLETGEPDPAAPGLGRIECSAEYGASVSAESEGRGAENLNVQLTSELERLLVGSSAIDLGQLCIQERKACWVVQVDALVLESSGSVVDAMALAAKAALATTTIPEVEVTTEGEIVPAADKPDRPFPEENVPVFVSLTKIGRRFVIDTSLEEEQCTSTRLVVAVNKKGQVCGTHKSGPGGIAPSAAAEMITVARRIGTDLIKRVEAIVGKVKQRSGGTGSTVSR